MNTVAAALSDEFHNNLLGIVTKLEESAVGPTDKIEYKNMIITEFVIIGGYPIVAAMYGDMEGLTGYTFDEVREKGLFEALKIKIIEPEKILKGLEKDNVVIKNNYLTTKWGERLKVTSILEKIAPNIVKERTWADVNEI